LNIPFTSKQFFDVFAAYNTAIWPAQVLAYVLGLLAVILAVRPRPGFGRMIAGLLALFWIGMGIAYHLVFFSAVNPAAWAFGFVFVAQGVLFLVLGVVMARLTFSFRLGLRAIVGAAFILFAFLVYPLLGTFAGHAYPRAPMFGVAPCPSTIFTFGLLLWARRPVPFYLLIIPLLWSLVGMSAAVSLGVPQDYGLAAAGLIGTALILIGNRRGHAAPSWD
jgi:hypothetical protein